MTDRDAQPADIYPHRGPRGVVREILPNPTERDLGKAALEEILRRLQERRQHPIGDCAMCGEPVWADGNHECGPTVVEDES